jgi:entericidin B
MGPDALTSPPGSASGLNFFFLGTASRDPQAGTEPAVHALSDHHRPGALAVEPFRRLHMKKLFAIFALAGTLVAATACNTVRGAGEDVESAANAVDNAT